MRLAVCLALAMVGCAAEPLRYRPAHVEPALGSAPEIAMATWQEATGWRYPERAIGWYIGNPGTGRAAVTALVGRLEDGHYNVTVSPDYLGPWLPRILLHELGHVAGLRPDPDHPDASHWHGAAPSVMRGSVDECSDEIGAPELAAFDRQYPR